MIMNLENYHPEIDNEINDIICSYNDIHIFKKKVSFEEQEQILLKALDLIPKPIEQWITPTDSVAIGLFELYKKWGKTEEAEKYLHIALKVREAAPSPSTYLDAGIFYFDLDKLDLAYQYFDLVYNIHRYIPFSRVDKKYWRFYKSQKETLKLNTNK